MGCDRGCDLGVTWRPGLITFSRGIFFPDSAARTSLIDVVLADLDLDPPAR